MAYIKSQFQLKSHFVCSKSTAVSSEDEYFSSLPMMLPYRFSLPVIESSVLHITQLVTMSITVPTE